MDRMYNITNFELKYKKYKSKYANNKKKMNNMNGGQLPFKTAIENMSEERQQKWIKVKSAYESEPINETGSHDNSKIRNSDRIITDKLYDIGNSQNSLVVPSSPRFIITPQLIDTFCIMHYSNPELIEKWKEFENNEDPTSKESLIRQGYHALIRYIQETSNLDSGYEKAKKDYVNYDGGKIIFYSL